MKTTRNRGIKVGNLENRIPTPEPYRGVRGLRHGPAPEAPQPLAHGPPGLHPAVGLQTSPAPGRPSPHTASFQDFPPHWPRALGPRATLSASAPRAPGLVAARLRPARTWAPSEAPHAPVLSSRATEQPGRSPDHGRPETKAQEADRPSPAPDAAGSRPRCGRHRASQLRPPVGLCHANSAASAARFTSPTLTFGV